MDKGTFRIPSLVLLGGLLVLIMGTSIVRAQEITERELPMLADVPTVITASKREQAIFESPSAITVITAEDIKYSGYIQLNQALMMVPGTHFGYTLSSFPLAGGIRGFHKLPANKVAMLVDGMPWDFEVYGIPTVTLPMSLEEVERIEVLRGPGSSLYGANAVFGVVNIIPKKPVDTKDSFLSLKVGDYNLDGTYYYGGSIDDRINYRYSISWNEMDNWDEYVAFTDDPVSKLSTLSSTADYLIDDNSKVNFFGSYSDARKLYSIQETTGPVEYRNVDFYTGALTYTSEEPNILIRGYYEDKDLMGTGLKFGSPGLGFNMGRRGLDFQNTLDISSKDILVWGVNLSHIYAEGTAVGGKRRHDTRGLFFDNFYKIEDNLGINTGLRYDHHPNTGENLSHRLAFLYSLTEEHHFRFTWATSFRNPDFIETYYSSPYPPNIPEVLGHEDNRAEKAETFELGYIGNIGADLDLTANLFFSEYADMVYFVQTGTHAGVVPIYEHINIENFKQYGTEIELKYAFTDWLTGLLNYTYLEQWEEDIAYKWVLDMTPQHMLNAQFRAVLDNGFWGNLSALYRGTTDWRSWAWPNVALGITPDPRGVTNAGGKAKDYVIFNLCLGYPFQILNNDAEISLAVFNLFDKEYDDYPLDTANARRMIIGKFSYKF